MKKDRCPHSWHIFGASRAQSVEFTRGYTANWISVSPAAVRAVLGWDPDAEFEDWPEDICCDLDDVRRMTHPEQASRRHPAVKPNRRRVHR